MRKGKMIAQGAHASLGAVLPYLRWSWRGCLSPSWRRNRRKVKHWLAGPFAKVCVRADSEDQLQAIYDQAVAAGLIACLITDAGRTEFHGVPTKTCIAIGPDTPENLAPVTGDLNLL